MPEIAHSLSPKLDTRITQKGFISGAVTGCGKALVLYTHIKYRHISLMSKCRATVEWEWEHQLLIRDSY